MFRIEDAESVVNRFKENLEILMIYGIIKLDDTFSLLVGFIFGNTAATQLDVTTIVVIGLTFLLIIVLVINITGASIRDALTKTTTELNAKERSTRTLVVRVFTVIGYIWVTAFLQSLVANYSSLLIPFLIVFVIFALLEYGGSLAVQRQKEMQLEFRA